MRDGSSDRQATTVTRTARTITDLNMGPDGIAALKKGSIPDGLARVSSALRWREVADSEIWRHDNPYRNSLNSSATRSAWVHTNS